VNGYVDRDTRTQVDASNISKMCKSEFCEGSVDNTSKQSTSNEKEKYVFPYAKAFLIIGYPKGCKASYTLKDKTPSTCKSSSKPVVYMRPNSIPHPYRPKSSPAMRPYNSIYIASISFKKETHNLSMPISILTSARLQLPHCLPMRLHHWSTPHQTIPLTRPLLLYNLALLLLQLLLSALVQQRYALLFRHVRCCLGGRDVAHVVPPVGVELFALLVRV
jgi:hypothetical protein